MNFLLWARGLAWIGYEASVSTNPLRNVIRSNLEVRVQILTGSLFILLLVLEQACIQDCRYNHIRKYLSPDFHDLYGNT